MVPTVYLPPMQMIPPQTPQKRKLMQRFIKRAHQIILIVPPLTSAL
jgi:hypothetical protein